MGCTLVRFERSLDQPVTHTLVCMRKITLSADEEVLAAVRRYAAERNTTVNALVREYLTGIATRHNRARSARVRLRELSEGSRAALGTKNWTREELH